MDTGLMSKSKKRENKKTFDFIVDCLHSPTELICLQKWTLQQVNGGGRAASSSSSSVWLR